VLKPAQSRGKEQGRGTGVFLHHICALHMHRLKDHLVIISIGAFCEVLRLVRTRSYALALGLGLVASEVCIPLNQWCLRAPCLYSAGLVSLARPHQPCLWCGRHRVGREQGPWCFGRKLDSEDSGEQSEIGLPKGTPETHLRVEKARGYPRSYLIESLALVRASLRGGSNED
jgi:hypothetical protein